MPSPPKIHFSLDDNDLLMSFDPPPETWVFDEAKGTRQLLAETLAKVLQKNLDAFPADACFDHAAQGKLRVAVLHVLLVWVSHFGLQVSPPVDTTSGVGSDADC